MRLIVNGEVRTVENIPNLNTVLKDLGYDGDYFAVAVNMKCIPRHQYESTFLQENDAVEILSPMQGG